MYQTGEEEARCYCHPFFRNYVSNVTKDCERALNAAAVADGASKFQLQFAASVERSSEGILEFVGKLNQETKTKLLLRVLRIGRGSLDFAKQLVADDLPKRPPSPAKDLPLCICCVCRPMDTEEEIICCKKGACITSYHTFNNICLDQDILEVCIKVRCDIWADDFNCSVESFRKAGWLLTICPVDTQKARLRESMSPFSGTNNSSGIPCPRWALHRLQKQLDPNMICSPLKNIYSFSKS